MHQDTALFDFGQWMFRVDCCCCISLCSYSLAVEIWLASRLSLSVVFFRRDSFLSDSLGISSRILLLASVYEGVFLTLSHMLQFFHFFLIVCSSFFMCFWCVGFGVISIRRWDCVDHCFLGAGFFASLRVECLRTSIFMQRQCSWVYLRRGSH